MSKKSKMEKLGGGKAKGGKRSDPAPAVKVSAKAVAREAVAVEEKSAGSRGKQGASREKHSAEGKRGMEERQVMLISKALADPTRLSIFRAIAKGGASCGSIKDCIAVSAATLSHHMKELEAAGLIETSREGRFMHAALHKKVWKSYVGELKSFAD